MFKKEPEGYRKLLAYKKALSLQQDTNELVRYLPKTKTFLDLADQMARSGRSGSKNIVEGWNRNTTKEYFTFLGFSIGAISELMEDAADVATGVYPEVLSLPEIMGERGVRAEKGVMGQNTEKGIKGERLGKGAMGEMEVMSREQLDLIKFYPLDTTLPPIIQLFLKAKEVSYLIYKLQQSLDIKMDSEGTKSNKDKFKERQQVEKEANKTIEQFFKDKGMVRLPNGQYVSKSKIS